MNYILLKFISNEKFLHDFLNGSLYMNTLYYYWNQYAIDKAQERWDRDLKNNPDLDPNNYRVPIKGGPGPGVIDLFEGTVGTERLADSNIPDMLKGHAQTDLVYRSVGMGYCNILCFYKMDYEVLEGEGADILRMRGIPVKYYLGDMHEFGDYAVIIDDLDELIGRIHKAVRSCGFKYSCGPVRYRKLTRNDKDPLLGHNVTLKEEALHDISNVKSRRDAFSKTEKYEYQREWRVVLYRGVKDKEPYRLEVGDLRDIVHWVKREDLDAEVKRIFMNREFKQPSSLWYGDDRHEIRDLFYKLGDYKVERFVLIGDVERQTHCEML